MSCLVLEEVRKARGSGRRSVAVLQGISLSVDPGEFVLLEGPSGAGKTTLLAVAAGLLMPDAGRVTLAGRVPTRSLRCRAVGFVFQRPNLLPNLTARENVVLMGELAGMTTTAAGAEADGLLSQLDVAPLADRWPAELSGGEEQRVSVARALVHRPAIVLADEPTGSLDTASGQVVVQLLAELAPSRGGSVLVATHDTRLATFATRRLRIADGKLEPVGETA